MHRYLNLTLDERERKKKKKRRKKNSTSPGKLTVEKARNVSFESETT